MIRRINLAAEQLRKIVIGSQRPQQCVTCFRILELFSEYLGPLQVARVEDCRLRIPDGRRIADQASIYIVVSRNDIHTFVRAACNRNKLHDPCERERIFRSEEQTSELQSLMRITYDVLC